MRTSLCFIETAGEVCYLRFPCCRCCCCCCSSSSSSSASLFLFLILLLFVFPFFFLLLLLFFFFSTCCCNANQMLTRRLTESIELCGGGIQHRQLASPVAVPTCAVCGLIHSWNRIRLLQHDCQHPDPD